jgi:hypothetical protein
VIGGKRSLDTMRSEERTGRRRPGGKREGADVEGGVMRVTQPAACFQSRRTELPCRACGECPSVVHFPTRYVGYYCEKCCPACRQKPAVEGESGSVPTPPDRILTMQEASACLGLPITTVARLVRETTIWGTKMDDGRGGIKESELRRFLSGRSEAKQRAKEK